ncbi:MAG: hypothetical protein ACJ8F1_24240 [Polyangia bacterium]
MAAAADDLPDPPPPPAAVRPVPPPPAAARAAPPPARPAPPDTDEPLPPGVAAPPAPKPSGPAAWPTVTKPAPAPTPPAGPPAAPAPVSVPAPAAAPPAGGPVPWPTLPPATTEAGAPSTAVAPAAASLPPGRAEGAAAFDDFRRRTKLGAWGEGQLFVDESSNTSRKLRWIVFSVEHRPTDWLRIAAAAQLEDGRHFGMQEAFIEAAPLAGLGARAGLMRMPVGLGNLEPEPTAELTVDRPLTDQLIIPMVWRELGAGIFGEVIPGLRYQGAVVSGLDASGFSPVAPLWGGRGDGSNLAIHDAAVTGRLELADLPPGLIVGAAGYIGGAAHGVPALSGVRAGLVEGDLRYRRHGITLRAEYARLYVVNSYLVNDYLGLLGQSAVPARGRGYYVELGYDLLQLAGAPGKQALVLFAAYENIDARSGMSPYNYNPPAITGPGQLAPEAASPARGFARGGLDYRPRPSIVLKVDVQVALNAVGVPGVPLQVATGAPGTPRPVGADAMDAARGATRVGVALGFNF